MKTTRAHLEEKKGQRSCFIAYHNIYMAEGNMYILTAGGFKCSKAEGELCSTADGSLPLTYVNLCAPECQ